MTAIYDLTEAELRSSGCSKWCGTPPGVLAAWVAEMDFVPDAHVVGAILREARDGHLGYGPPDRCSRLPAALTEFVARQWRWDIDEKCVVSDGDVLACIERVVSTIAGPGGVVLPTPTYPPLLTLFREMGREIYCCPVDPDLDYVEIDLRPIEQAFRQGARILMLCSPQNPLGHVFTAGELTSLCELAEAYDAFIVSDEIHAPLVLPGSSFVPLGKMATRHNRYAIVTSATKAWNVPSMKCASIICQDPEAAEQARQCGLPQGHSILGVAGSVAAYEDGGDWLAGVIDRIAANVALFADVVSSRLPKARMRPIEGSYLAWLDARSYHLSDTPGHVALEVGRVLVDYRDFGPGSDGHVRVNLATSAERVLEIGDRLARAWEGA